MATGINRHKTVRSVETWQTAGSDSRPARVTHNGSHLSMMHWNFYEDSSVSVRFCQMWDVTFLGSYDVQKSMFRMHWNMQHLTCMRANMSVHINKCLNCGCANMHFFVRRHDDWFIFCTGAGGKKPRKYRAKRLKGAKCLSETVRILSWRAKTPCGANPLVSEASWVTFLPHLKKVKL